MKKFFEEFKAFAMKGNVVDMAVGVIIGGAFGKIVSSLVADIITPLIGILTGNVDLSSLKIVLSEENAINYGAFIQNVIDFVIIALSIFVMIKVVNKVSAKVNAKKIAEEEEKKAEEAAKPKPPTTEELLADILAELKSK